MTACRTAAFAAHAAARDATVAEAPDAVAAARAAGQAAAVAYMFDHLPCAAAYAATAIGLHGAGEADRPSCAWLVWCRAPAKVAESVTSCTADMCEICCRRRCSTLITKLPENRVTTDRRLQQVALAAANWVVAR